jgi:hypothetical protein
MNGVYREDGVFADVGMTMFHAGVTDQHRRFKELGVLAETKGCAADIFVWMLPEIIIIGLEYSSVQHLQDHSVLRCYMCDQQ